MSFEMVIFDTETTGLLNPDNSPLEEQPKIIEFYGVRVNEDFDIIQEVEEYIDPKEPLSPEITRITGIKDHNVQGAPVFGDVAPKIADLINGADLLIAHNIAFDNGMLENEFKRIGLDRPTAKHDLCTVQHLIPEYGYRITLSALYKKLYDKYFKAHRAKSDVFALVSCVHRLIDMGVINLDIYKD